MNNERRESMSPWWIIGNFIIFVILLGQLYITGYYFWNEAWGMSLFLVFCLIWFINQALLNSLYYWLENIKFTANTVSLIRLSDMIVTDQNRGYITKNIPMFAFMNIIALLPYDIIDTGFSSPAIWVNLVAWALLMPAWIVQGAYGRHRATYYSDFTEPS
jgi:hypothetical protein